MASSQIRMFFNPTTISISNSNESLIYPSRPSLSSISRRNKDLDPLIGLILLRSNSLFLRRSQNQRMLHRRIPHPTHPRSNQQHPPRSHCQVLRMWIRHPRLTRRLHCSRFRLRIRPGRVHCISTGRRAGQSHRRGYDD